MCLKGATQLPVQRPLQSLSNNSGPISFPPWKSASYGWSLGRVLDSWTHFGCATLVVMLWPHVMPRENKSTYLQSTALICVCKAIQRGEKPEESWKRKKAWIRSCPNWLDEDKLWMKEAVSCPTKLSHEVHPKHTPLYLATKSSPGALALNNFTAEFIS